MRRRTLGSRSSSSASPRTSTRPSSGFARPINIRRSVVFPHPLGPRRTVVFPRATSRSIGPTVDRASKVRAAPRNRAANGEGASTTGVPGYPRAACVTAHHRIARDGSPGGADSIQHEAISESVRQIEGSWSDGRAGPRSGRAPGDGRRVGLLPARAAAPAASAVHRRRAARTADPDGLRGAAPRGAGPLSVQQPAAAGASSAPPTLSVPEEPGNLSDLRAYRGGCLR